MLLWFLHWLVSGCSFEQYSHDGRWNTNIAKSFLRACLDYVLKYVPLFITQNIKTRPQEEMKQLADVYYDTLGKLKIIIKIFYF